MNVEFDKETAVLPPLSPSIVVRCLEQDQWLVRIGEGLLDAFLLDYISSNHPNADVGLVVNDLTSFALLARLLDSLGIYGFKSNFRKKRAFHAFIGAINRELTHDRLVNWLEDLWRPHIEVAVHGPSRPLTKEVISLDDSDSEDEVLVQAVEASLADLSVEDAADVSIQEEASPLSRAELATADLVPTLPNIVSHFERDDDDIHKNDRCNFLRILRLQASNVKRADRPMSEFGLDVDHDLRHHEAIPKMPHFPYSYPPPLPLLSDKGLFETLTPKNFYSKAGGVYDNERLEFLGDTVLETVVTDAIFDKFPRYQPWDLTKLRKRLVNNNFLSFFSDLYGLSPKLRGNYKLHAKKKADIFEAYIGALYRESGHSNTNKWLVELLEPFMIHYTTQM